MKKSIIIFGVCILSFTLLAQEISHETLVINIEVPVRVFKGSRFIDNLTIDDFEVYENGKLQRLEAVYLVKKKAIERKDEKKKFSPDTSRTFYLFFEITDYSPRIEDALHYFMQNVVLPGDSLVIVSPMKTYEMNPQALELKSNDEIVKELKGLLRKDAMIGSSEYRSSMTELTRITRAFAGVLTTQEEGGRRLDQFSASEFAEAYEQDPELLLQILLENYRLTLERLEMLRYIDQPKLLDFARTLKDKEGQKYVFLFYQREYIPMLEPTLLMKIDSLFQSSQHITHDLASLFQMYRREITFDVDWVNQAFADSSASIHFMFFTKPAQHVPGLRFEEHSEDIYSAFRQMATATGGITESSSNPFTLFRTAVESSENYYLLYYTPLNYKKDGQFKNIKIKVRDADYKVIHRAGYFAN
ncbi:hypothetical protein ES703_43389 [subsurface metagenome]|nr:hypothetical protein [bacterium]